MVRVVAGPIEHKNIISTPIFKEKMVLITSNKIDNLGKKYEGLEEKNLLVFRVGCSYRKHLEKFLDSQHFVPSKIMEFGSLDAIIGCVGAGMGVSILPLSVVETKKEVRKHHLPVEFQQIDTHFIYRSSSSVNPCCSLFLETSRQENLKLITDLSRKSK
ncbi:LysR substrate-binding domain-containing protein [Alteribacillus sp. HJP-4]|uniref:LysR substrate-binding domain-containing protein n=1 Tax=Alteribacillus sp. HJP-4 TaxID=2775394 RepID=UPI0035CD2BF2